MNKKRQSRDTFLRKLWKSGSKRIKREPKTPAGKEMSDDTSALLKVMAPLG